MLRLNKSNDEPLMLFRLWKYVLLLALKFYIAIIILTFSLVITKEAIADLSFEQKLVNAAIFRTTKNIKYDGNYYVIDYPLGDVPKNIGVCTDVIIRSYRSVGIDLQQEIHEDISKNFHLYPKKWGLKQPNTNIDHRRVPNLEVFFKRFGESLSITKNPEDYKPGDIVTWNIATWWKKILKNRDVITHIGIVTDRTTVDNIPIIVHNIGFGTKLNNMLFDYEIIGHYRYNGKN